MKRRALLGLIAAFAVYPTAFSAEPKPDLAHQRLVMADDLVAYLSKRYPHLNFIKPAVRKHGKGYLVLATHDFFNRHAFSIGQLAHDVDDWLQPRYQRLRELKVVGVGVWGRGEYASDVYYEIPL